MIRRHRLMKRAPVIGIPWQAALIGALLLQLGGCATLNPTPSEEFLRARDQTTIGRAPAEEGMGPGVPPTGPVLAPATRRGTRPDGPVPVPIPALTGYQER